ncbi:hypothetical protein GBS0709_29180 [Edwardsiella tarda]|nr:hypothetical protein GBS0709_29180 [Edwardsiella tarda]
MQAGHHLKGSGVDEVADQYAGGITEGGVSGGFTPSHIRFIDDIIVQECRGMDEFDEGGDGNMAIPLVVERTRRQYRDHRTDPLAAAADDVIAKLVDERDVRV